MRLPKNSRCEQHIVVLRICGKSLNTLDELCLTEMKQSCAIYTVKVKVLVISMVNRTPLHFSCIIISLAYFCHTSTQTTRGKTQWINRLQTLSAVSHCRGQFGQCLSFQLPQAVAHDGCYYGQRLCRKESVWTKKQPLYSQTHCTNMTKLSRYAKWGKSRMKPQRKIDIFVKWDSSKMLMNTPP